LDPQDGQRSPRRRRWTRASTNWRSRATKSARTSRRCATG
jgi:hypothetical protein